MHPSDEHTVTPQCCHKCTYNWPYSNVFVVNVAKYEFLTEEEWDITIKHIILVFRTRSPIAIPGCLNLLTV